MRTKNTAICLRPDLEGSENFEPLAAGIFLGFFYEVWANKKHGHRCGYVGIPKGHPWFRLDTRHIGENDPCNECGREAPEEWRGEVAVHGGLSYGGLAHAHTSDEVYVVGFSCDNTSDLADPLLNKERGEDEAHLHALHPTSWERSVKSTEYCVEQCKTLCRSIADKWEAVAS
jgi:hypothetical protein